MNVVTDRLYRRLQVMSTQRILFTLTAVNLGLLVWQVIHPHETAAKETTPILRGRELQLVDATGRVRAEIKVLPRDPAVKMPDGTTGYPETVLLRLIDSQGRPNVKIAATEDGSAMSLGGNTNPTHVQILSRGDRPLMKLVGRDGKQELIQP
jgi:hypothetical protein